MPTPFSWRYSDDFDLAAVTTGLATFSSIEELNYSQVFVPFEYRTPRLRVALYNTDPINWNIYMFPFRSQKARREVQPNDLRNALASEASLRSYFDLPAADASHLPTQCEIKLSLSSHRTTLYVFNYELIALDDRRFDYADERVLAFETRSSIGDEFLTRRQDYATNVAETILLVWDRCSL